MKRGMLGALILQAFCACSLCAAAAGAQESDPALWSRAEKEKFLLEAKILRRRDAGKGITGSVRVTLTDERGTHDAHVQTIDEARARFETPMGTEFNFKDTWKFNLAAYILDRLLDINMIPVTVERRVEGRRASVTWWIDDVLMDELQRRNKKVQPPDAEAWNRQMYVVRVFDQLIANTDRNLGNVVITKNWDIWMIDHTRAFRLTTQLPEPKNLVKCDRYLLANLRKLDRATLREKAGAYLNGMEIDGVLARRDAIVKFFENKIAAEGEAAVLYDYLLERKRAYPWMQ